MVSIYKNARFSQFLNLTMELHFLELHSHLTILPCLKLASKNSIRNNRHKFLVDWSMDLNLNTLSSPINVSSDSHLTTKCIIYASLLIWTIKFLAHNEQSDNPWASLDTLVTNPNLVIGFYERKVVRCAYYAVVYASREQVYQRKTHGWISMKLNLGQWLPTAPFFSAMMWWPTTLTTRPGLIFSSTTQTPIK